MMSSASNRIGVIAAAAAAVVVLAWGLLLFRPQMQNVGKIHRQQAAAEAQVTDMQETVSGLQEQVRQVPAAQNEYTALLAALPDNPQLPAAIQQINAAAAASGYSVKAVSPTKPGAPGTATKSPGGVQAIPVSISGTGSYEQTTAFITDLLAGSRIFEITTVSITGSTSPAAPGTPAALSSQLSAQMFSAGQPTP
jgi:type IV pilus assembly protein PilO